MLVGAMDVSGNPKKGNHVFMGLVIGTKENLDAMINNLQLNKLSASTVKQNKTRSDLASKIRFNGKENIGFCIRLDRREIISDVKEKTDSKYAVIYQRYNRLLLKFMREKINEFLIMHKAELSKVGFQCDADCNGFISDNNLCSRNQEFVHTLADLVAWSNNRGKEPNGVIYLDPREWIRKELNRIFK